VVEEGPAAPVPSNEAARLLTLESYQILDTGRDARFEELAAALASLCGTPVATITFVDAKRQWFKAAVGMPFEELDRDVAFCSYTILDPGGTLVVEDTSKDERFANNPLVIGDPHLMAYAGAPMVAPDGTVIGTVCAMDHEPRSYTPGQLAVLRRVAAQVVEMLDSTSTAELPLDGPGTDTDVEVLDGREGATDEVLAITRPLIEAIGEDVEIVGVLERFCADMVETFGWWGARVSWVHREMLRPDPWVLAKAAPPVLAPLAGLLASAVELEGLGVRYRDPVVQDVGMLRWLADRDAVVGLGGRHAVVLDVPGAHSLAARIVFLLPSVRAFSGPAVRTLTTAAAVLPRVFVQDRARRELTYRATHDMLTGLLNREGVTRRYFGVVGEHGMRRAVLYVDLDNFKVVNDTFGHRAGDEVLSLVGRQIAGRIRPTDTAARLGGDEFIVVLDGILEEGEALRVARRLLQALCGTFTVFHMERASIAVSIGVAMWGPGMVLDEAIEAADGLMYAAKELGGSSIAMQGEDGRRLLGIDESDVRDLETALSGAMHVKVAPAVDREGAVRALRVTVGVEVRHPAVDELVGLVLRGVQPYLAEVPQEVQPTLLITLASLLWATDGLVLRLLVALRSETSGMPMQLVVASEQGDDATIRQAVLIRDALDVGLVVGRFGSPGGGDLMLVDRLDPVALELEPGVLEPGTTGPSSTQVAACALALSRGLSLLVPCDPGQEPADVFAVLDESCDQGGSVLLVDLGAATEHRREPGPSRSLAGREAER
jgi:diguanylate cyclase (GGDEF)-like protein